MKMVEEELKMDVREDIRAASITASIIPLNTKSLLFFCISRDLSREGAKTYLTPKVQRRPI